LPLARVAPRLIDRYRSGKSPGRTFRRHFRSDVNGFSTPRPGFRDEGR